MSLVHRATPRFFPACLRSLAGLCLMLAALPALCVEVQRIEPGNWWVGMRSNTLQLMVYGDGIARSTPRIDHPQVRIAQVTRTDSANHLFIDLVLGPDLAPGGINIEFREGDARRVVAYPLLQRESGSADRQGFGPADAILNLMPDRFANGDPSNDSVAGMLEQADRNAPSGRHGGDLLGIESHLDYIAGMGYTQIWATPVVENNQPGGAYHGYAATDLYRVDPRLGSNQDYRRLVATARSKGIGVIHDIVPNHIGSGHRWMRDRPAADWINHGFKFSPTNHARNSLTDPYAAQADRDDFVTGWFVPSMPDLNQRNPLLATYLVQNAIWWIEYAGLSGYRVDTVGYSDTAFLAQWNRRILQEYPKFSIVGEEWSLNPLVVARWQQGSVWPVNAPGMPNMMDFPLSETLRTALVAAGGHGGGLDAMYSLLVNDPHYPDPRKLVLFEGNHDMSRLYSVLGNDMDLFRMAMVYLATAPRIPQLYYGTEVLMESPIERNDAAARRGFPGGWPGDPVNAFTGQGLSERQRQAQALVRTLLNWRKATPAIHQGKMLHYAPVDGVYVYFRHDDQQRYMVVLNQNNEAVDLALARYAEGIAGARTARSVLDDTRSAVGSTLKVPARGSLLLRLE
ncbi:MAG: glycoside hydrolase family 13 protein [Pseudoxanthomonas sp.]|nr:glycoside hydrolase family 13 protein [Pseudoxanthomonas sp.]